MRLRLRDQHPPEVLAQLYPAPHDHTRWPDHLLRVQATIAVARWMSSGEAASVGLTKCRSGADLSCGDGAILKSLDLERKVFGDFAPGYEVHAPIEQSMVMLDPVDIFILTETLEHLNDPDEVLKTLRLKASRLILSTPLGANADPHNPEHYWAWDRDDVRQMLADAGWKWVVEQTVCFPEWINHYLIYGCV